MIAWADVQAFFPGDPAIQAVSSGVGAVFVTAAYAQMNATNWTRPNSADTSLLDLGARYLAAHMFTTGNAPGGAGGPVSAEKAGDVARTRNVKQDDAAWDSTPYGREFRRLMRTLGIDSRFMVAGANTPVPPPYSSGFFP